MSNNRSVNGGTFHATSLACAMSEQAVSAFDMLVMAGASLTPDLCPVCDDIGRTSLVESAVYSRSYPLIWQLLQSGVATSRDIETIVFAFENSSPGERGLLDPNRQRIIDWVREQGVEINPKSGSASLRRQLGLD